MPAFHISTSVHIEKPVAEVEAVISDFNTWPIWSPWLLMERDCEVNVKGEPATIGHGYSWEGNKVGAGAMEWTKLDNHCLDADLRFLKPFKSTADIGFKLTANGSGTDVEWWMDSSLPFFMFWMVSSMKGMIKMDYDRGLRLLKDHIEIGEVHSDIQIDPNAKTPSFSYMGVSKTCTIGDISESLESAYATVMAGLGHSPLGFLSVLKMLKKPRV